MATPTLDLALERHPSTALRPESFGALAYHYDTRRLLLIKDNQLAAVVEMLAEAPSARAALASCGVEESRHAAFELALEHLIASHVIRRREQP